MTRTGPISQRKLVAALVAAAALLALMPVFTTNTASAAAIQNPAGPLTRVEISPELNCAVSYLGDASPSFYGDTACATLVATSGQLFGPSSIPAGSSAGPRSPYTPVSQTQGGTGTGADPFVVTTVVAVGEGGLQLTQRDSYVVGQETYRTDITVANTGASPATATVYKAADCYLQDSDVGYGRYDASTGAVACVAGQDPDSRIEQFYPLSPGSRYLESYYGNVWAHVGTQQPFPNECAACDTAVDNGMGLSWDLTVPPGEARQLAHLTNFSPLGNVPLETVKTAASPQSNPGASNSYTITINNPNPDPVVLSSLSDDLPPGFTYVAGSTTGTGTTDPTVTGSRLTWAGPFTVPAAGSAAWTFGVTVSSTTGTYLNSASAVAEGIYTVAPSGPTAPIEVTGSTGADPTITEYRGPSSVQYSDPVALSGRLTDAGSGSPISGQPLQFTLGAQSVAGAPTDASGISTAAPTPVLQSPGTVSTVVSSFAGDATAGLAPSSDSDPFAIVKEDCGVAYRGPVTADAGLVSLAAQFSESDDSPGDWSGRTLTFVIDGSLRLTATTNAAGEATTTTDLTRGDHSVAIEFGGDVDYEPCNAAPATVAVGGGTQGGDKVVGHGTIKVPRSCWQGHDGHHAQVRRSGNDHRPPSCRHHRHGRGHDVVHFDLFAREQGGAERSRNTFELRSQAGRFRATSFDEITIEGDRAELTGSGRWDGRAGAAFTVTVVDGGRHGDRIEIEIRKGRTVLFTSRGAQRLHAGHLRIS